MAGISAATRAQWEKQFPPVQLRSLRGMGMVFLSAYKKSTDTYTGTGTTLTADSELVIPNVPANVPFAVSGAILVTTAGTAGIQLDWNNSTGVLGAMSIAPLFSIAAGTQAAGTVQAQLNTIANGGTVATVLISVSGIIQLATPGSIGLRFAQNAASGATTVNPGSFFYMEALDSEQAV